MYVFVGARKLYYRSNRDGSDARKAGLDFDAPLRPGVNIITVVARENPDTTTRRTLVVRKDGQDANGKASSSRLIAAHPPPTPR